jgi:hypothetical protein
VSDVGLAKLSSLKKLRELHASFNSRLDRQ